MASEHIQIFDVEKQTVLKLAECGALCGYDLHLSGRKKSGNKKAIMSSSYWLKVKEHIGLNGLGLISKVELHRQHSTDQRGRRKDLFWLTELGIAYAIQYGANLNLLMENIKKVYPNDTDKMLIVDLAKFDKKLFYDAFTIMQKTSNDISTNISLATLIYSKRLNRKDAKEKLRQLGMVLKKYPNHYNIIPSALETSEKELRKIRQIFLKENS